MIFSFIKGIKNKIKDAKTISLLCQGAEKYANLNGENKPGAEHFLLSALDLPDGSAKNIFNRLGISADDINEAIKKQHLDALQEIGIDASVIALEMTNDEAITPKLALYDTQPSGQVVMQKLYQRNKEGGAPLISAHVVDVISSMEQGIAARAIKVLNIDFVQFKSAIAQECR